jgi:hypothetical protein
MWLFFCWWFCGLEVYTSDIGENGEKGSDPKRTARCYLSRNGADDRVEKTVGIPISA